MMPRPGLGRDSPPPPSRDFALFEGCTTRPQLRDGGEQRTQRPGVPCQHAWRLSRVRGHLKVRSPCWLFQEMTSHSGPVRNASWARNGCFQEGSLTVADLDIVEQGIRAGVQAVLQVRGAAGLAGKGSAGRSLPPVRQSCSGFEVFLTFKWAYVAIYIICVTKIQLHIFPFLGVLNSHV